MADEQPNRNEGASTDDDLKRQNPGGTTTGDLTGDAEKTEPQDPAKAARAGFDPNEEQE